MHGFPLPVCSDMCHFAKLHLANAALQGGKERLFPHITVFHMGVFQIPKIALKKRGYILRKCSCLCALNLAGIGGGERSQANEAFAQKV